MTRSDPAARLARFGLEKLPYWQRDRRVQDLLDLTGTRVAVTGGGGANLGQAIVHRMAGAGADVAVIDRDESLASGVAEAAAKRWGTRVHPFTADLSRAAECLRVVDEVRGELGDIDVWVNNVGGGAGGFAAMTVEDIDRIVGTTFLCTLYSTHAVLPGMLERGRGTIVNISSEGGLMANPYITLYSSCKAGVDGFTRNLASEVGPRGVRVVGVRPGMMLGEPLVASLSDPEKYADRLASMSDTIDRISVGRACLPEEVANMVVFLVSPAGAHVHGTSVSVGGGMSA
jgi:3-oxoacyl-[acyl-carrier protein] reductase